MKHALHEALRRRKVMGPQDQGDSPDAQDEANDKKLDLAPDIKDKHVNIAIKVAPGEGSPEEEASESPAEEQSEADMLAGHKLMPHELDRLQNQKPRSLLEAAQKYALRKKG